MIINEVCGRSNGKQATWNEYINRMIHLMAEQLSTDYHGTAWVINHYFQQAKSQIDNQVQLKPDYYKYYKIGDDKMRVMISLPMAGIPDEQVKKTIDDLKEKFAKYHIEVEDSFINDEASDDIYHPGVFYLGRTIMNFLSKVDAVYFVDGWENARGCRIERAICEEYGIMILDEKFFRDFNDKTTRENYYADGIRINQFGHSASKQFDGYTVNIDANEKHIPQID